MKKILLVLLPVAMLLVCSGCSAIKNGFTTLIEKEKEILDAVGRLSDEPDEEGKYEIIYDMDGNFYWAVASETDDKIHYNLYIYSDKNDFPHFKSLLCSGIQVDGDNSFSPDWTGFGSCIVNAYIGKANHPIKVNGTLTGWFAYMSEIEMLDLSYLDSEDATSCRNMFMGCKSLKTVNLTDFKTGNVTDFSSMFADCTSLEKLDLSSFDTSKADNFSCMFMGSTINELNIKGFIISGTADTTDMYADCNIASLITD